MYTVRFHIICAERLCEESHHDFSPKLNDENLTKCLQTLQYIYYDLSLEGIPCPREYEFRAYDVLMNMNQGDTLRKVQTLGEHLRTHDRVRFAIKCFTALNSNNYVAFFNLVSKASFLEACILKRYFYQVMNDTRCSFDLLLGASSRSSSDPTRLHFRQRSYAVSIGDCHHTAWLRVST